MLELRSFSHKIKSIEEAESTKAECFEITEKLIKYRKDASTVGRTLDPYLYGICIVCASSSKSYDY